MRSNVNTGGSPQSKPVTRNSIRQSLNLASVGKALGEIMSKDADKAAKKAKEANARRMSAIPLTIGTSRTSFDINPPSPKREDPFDSKTVTTRSRVRKLSVAPKPPTESNVDSVKPLHTSGFARSLRPRDPTSSNLPKYRPKSVVIDPVKKPPSPLRSATRRRLSSSDDEPLAGRRMSNETPRKTAVEKMARAISPLPHRATFKINTSAVNVSVPTTPPRGKTPSINSKASPPHPTKTVKVTHVTHPSGIPRPPSSASSSSSPLPSPRTPKGSAARSHLSKSGRENTHHESSPLRSTSRPPPDSPVPHRPPKVAKVNGSSPRAKPSFMANMSHISEGKGEDSFDAEDVAMLLAPIAPLTAPTPAMPRPQSTNRYRQPTLKPQARSSNAPPTRSNRSHISPTRPGSESSALLQPPSSNNRLRSSILSWEQLASEARTLGEEEIETMLADMQAPFVANSPSPRPRPNINTISAPDSPCLTALHSPGAYGSISQVLLPDVTPSPHHTSRYDNAPTQLPAVDAAIVTLLRLQLASAEEAAKERSVRAQSLEEELCALKEIRRQETEDLQNKVARMEEQLRHVQDVREKAEEERAAYTAALEDQVRHDQASLEQAIQEAVEKAMRGARLSQDAALQSERCRWEVGCSARDASAAWASVRDMAECDLDLVRTSMETLSALSAGLEQCRWQISAAAS